MDIHMQKKKNLDPDLTSFTKINSRWIIGLKVKIKPLEDNITENLDDLRYGDAFFDTNELSEIGAVVIPDSYDSSNVSLKSGSVS